MPTYATAEEYCRTLDAIQAGFSAQVQKLAGKFAALRRLASLLQLSGATIPIPNPADLIPVHLIDFNRYQELVALCPGILPPYTGQTLEDLRATVDDAYRTLLSQALNHPYAQMSELQGLIAGEIESLADKVAQAIGPGLDITSCIAAVCGVAAQGGVLFGPEVFDAAKQAFVTLASDNPEVTT